MIIIEDLLCVHDKLGVKLDYLTGTFNKLYKIGNIYLPPSEEENEPQRG